MIRTISAAFLSVGLPVAAIFAAVSPAGAGDVPSPAADGAQLFAQNCSACHQMTGMGIPGAFPALAGDKFVTGDPSKPVAVVLNGRAGMPTFKADLDDAQIAAVLSFVRSNWGNKAPAVPAALVTTLRGGASSAGPAAIQAH